MISKKIIDSIKEKYSQISHSMQDEKIFTDHKKYIELSKQFSEIEQIYKNIVMYEKMLLEKTGAEKLLEKEEGEIKELAAEELELLKNKIILQEKIINGFLLPKDANDNKNVIMEIRAGTGGDESALFAADLFRMYSRYSEQMNWKIEIYSCSETGLDGFKEIIFLMNGKDVYSRLKFESGVHRVQRVPVTENSGRVHTSAATVSVLPEADDIEVQIKPDDLKIDTYRASGAGGQHVNTTDSAVRITHIPTGIVAGCQDERSQHKNKAKAMSLLKTKIYDVQLQNKEKEHAQMKKIQVGSGDRSEKIRTYNFPQNRITDHRINFTLYKLQEVLNGSIDELIDALIEENENQRIKLMASSV